MSKPTTEVVFSQSGGLFPSATLKTDGKATHRLNYPRGTKFGAELKAKAERQLKKGEGKIPKRKKKTAATAAPASESRPNKKGAHRRGGGGRAAGGGEYPHVHIGGTPHRVKATTALMAKIVHQLLCKAGLKAHCTQELSEMNEAELAELASMGYRHTGVGRAGMGRMEAVPGTPHGREYVNAGRSYTATELENMPTLIVSQADDLKVDTGKVRVWLARTTVADGEPYDNKITVEALENGRWEVIEEYPG